MSKERLLILDPEANTQWTLKVSLEEEDFSVITANSIDQAIENFKENELSGLITEYRVGHSSTLNAVREFKKIFPEAFVMMLSNEEVLENENEYEEIINAGIDDFFQKPTSFRKVLLHLKRGLKQRANAVLEKNLPGEPEPVVLDSAVREGPTISKI